jgi:hypothetical protein
MKTLNDHKFRNIVGDTYLDAMDKRPPLQRDFCACGLAATGEDEIIDAEEVADDTKSVKTKAMNLQAWKYFKTGLALVGAYVVIKFLYGKLVK